MEFLKERQRKANPKEKANILSEAFFLYTLRFFQTAFSKGLEEKDIYKVPVALKSQEVTDRFEEEWQKEKLFREKPHILRVLANCYGRQYFLLGFGILVARLTAVNIGLYATGKLVSYFAPNSSLTQRDAHIYASIIILLTLLESLYIQNYKVRIAAVKIRVRVVLCSLIYRKALRMSDFRIKNTSIGKIVTFITKDVATFENFLDEANEIWMGFFKSGVTICILYIRIGIAATVPILSFMVFTPIQIALAFRVAALKQKMFTQTDKRLQATQEILFAIRVIKIYILENVFRTKVSHFRQNEMQYMYKMLFLKFIVASVAVLNIWLTFIPLMVLYKSLGNQITAEIVYYTISCYRFLSHPFNVTMPNCIYQVANVVIAAARIDKFLATEELEPTKATITTSTPQVCLQKITISVENTILLKNVNLILVPSLNLLTGAVGVGKTVLLKTILQECQPTAGNVLTEGSISYASQEPWLFPSSLRQNIIFGEKFDEQRYREVLRVCCLDYDFQQFQDGDQTIVESYGMNLSGGQQVRVNLARAVYRDSQIYLLDDCLSSLDQSVSNFIFKECFQKFLKEKIVILVTQDKRLIETSDNVFVMGEKKLTRYGQGDCRENTIHNDKFPTDNMHCYGMRDKTGDENKTETATLLPTSIEKNIYEETKNDAQVAFGVYKDYIKNGGGYIFLFCIIFVYALVQGSTSYLNRSVSIWANIEEKMSNFTNFTSNTEREETSQKLTLVIIIHCVVIALLAFLTLASGGALFYFSKKVSVRLHQRMMESVTNAPLKFFDNNFTGNILNRFSRDLNIIDEVLPFHLHDVFNTFFMLVGAITLIIIVNTIFLVPTLILICIFVALRLLYLPTGRNLKRLEASTKSPVVSHLSSTLEGITTVRVSKAEQVLKKEFDAHQDLHTSASFTFQCTFQAFVLFLELVCWILISIIIVKFLISGKGIDAGSVGLAIFQAFTLRLHLSTGIRQWAEIENQMTSVERVMQYIEIKRENQQGVSLEKWSTAVEIRFKNVCLIHDGSNDYILKSISFVVKPMEKIAIVGRTGSGKSSLISTFFRFYDYTGKVFINEADVKTLALNFLRSNISIVPQNPMLFNSTIRENIDPTGEYTDNEIWNVIRIVNLTKVISTLDLEIANNSYFSACQKQLICLARALIKNNQILLLDEVTAGTDAETEILIGNIIKEKCSSRTVLIVTHHLESVLSCNRVMVLDKGKIVEFENPLVLLKNRSSVFYNMMYKYN